MPWINLTLRRGALSKDKQHATMAQLTEALMFWEKVPDTPKARRMMKGWVYEVDEDADYNGGSHEHDKPFYLLEVRIPRGRLDILAKQGIIRDFTTIMMRAEGADEVPENANRVWVAIQELDTNNWGIGGHTDWLRSYTSALDTIHQGPQPD